MSSRRILTMIAVVVILATLTILQPGTKAVSRYDSVGLGLYQVRTKHRDGMVNLRAGAGMEYWVMNMAGYGTRYIVMEVVDGWALVIEPVCYDMGRDACKWICTDYLVKID